MSRLDDRVLPAVARRLWLGWLLLAAVALAAGLVGLQQGRTPVAVAGLGGAVLLTAGALLARGGD